MNFVRIPAARHTLGWRYTERLPADVVGAIDAAVPLEALVARFSRARTVALDAFDIAATAIALEDLVGDPYDVAERFPTLGGVCDHVDARLASDGLRLPTEDELEAAVGGELFAWGMTVPDGEPYGNDTTFEAHRHPNAAGLFVNHDPYRVELTRCALKLGDGGAAICGRDPWPMAWLALSPSHRQLDADLDGCLPEWLESTRVRPVKRAR